MYQPESDWRGLWFTKPEVRQAGSHPFEGWKNHPWTHWICRCPFGLMVHPASSFRRQLGLLLHYHIHFEVNTVEKKKRTILQKLEAGSLSISIIFHAVLLVLGLVWVFKIIPPPPEKRIDFMPTSGRGGSPSSLFSASTMLHPPNWRGKHRPSQTMGQSGPSQAVDSSARSDFATESWSVMNRVQ